MAELETMARKVYPPSPNFYSGQKSAKFGLNFRPQSSLTRSRSQTVQQVCKLKHALKAQVIALYVISKFDVVWSNLHRGLSIAISGKLTR